MLNIGYSGYVEIVIRILQYGLTIFPTRKKLHGFFYILDAKTGEKLWFNRIFNPKDNFVGNKLYNPEEILRYADEAKEKAEYLVKEKRLLTSSDGENSVGHGAIKIKQRIRKKSIVLALKTNLGEKIDEGTMIIFALLMGWIDEFGAYRIIKPTLNF